MRKRILVVAAHPDDEVLGCAGTLAKWTREGAVAELLILGQGLAARGPQVPGSFEKLSTHCRNSAKLTGYREVHFENLSDNQFDTVSLLSITRLIEARLQKAKPHFIFTHHPHDLNIDHRRCAEAVLTACRPLPSQTFPERIYFFEVLSVTEWRSHSPELVFLPNVFVNIEKTLAVKKKALQAYSGEVRPYPHPRSIQGIEILAKRRGLEVGLRFAESFRLVRQIEF